MEVHIAGSTEDKLLSSLHLDSKRSASYVTARNEVTFTSSSGGAFSARNGIRVLRFALNDNSGGFLDGESIRLAFVIRNTGAAAITPLSASPSSIFRRLRLLGGGVEITDISDYGRFHESMTMLKSSGDKLNDMAEGWGGTAAATLTEQHHADPIPAGAERRVTCGFYSAFLNQKKKILLSAMTNLVLELELGDPGDCFAEPEVDVDFTIIRPTILCTLLQCDAALMSSFSSHLLDGKSLTYNNPQTVFTMKTVVTSADFSLPISRGFSRISTVIFSFYRGVAGTKEIITFNHPLGGAAPNGVNDTLRYYLSIGSMRTPVMDVEGVAEQFMRTRTAVSIMDRDEKSLDFAPYRYRNTQALFALNLEKAIKEGDDDIGHMGLSTRNGSQLTLNLKGCPQNADGTPVMLHVTILYDSMVQLSAAGVSLLD